MYNSLFTSGTIAYYSLSLLTYLYLDIILSIISLRVYVRRSYCDTSQLLYSINTLMSQKYCEYRGTVLPLLPKLRRSKLKSNLFRPPPLSFIDFLPTFYLFVFIPHPLLLRQYPSNLSNLLFYPPPPSSRSVIPSCHLVIHILTN